MIKPQNARKPVAPAGQVAPGGLFADLLVHEERCGFFRPLGDLLGFAQVFSELVDLHGEDDEG